MIVDRAGTRAVSSMGWLERGALWVCDVDSDIPRSVYLSQAESLRLFEGADDHFAVVHDFRRDGLRIGVHCIATPDKEIAACEIADPSTARFHGDAEIWSKVPRYYVGYITGDKDGRAADYLIAIEREPPRARLTPLNWLTKPLDEDYEAPTSVIETPDRRWIIVSMSRTSTLIVLDPRRNVVERKLKLAARRGNPHPRFRMGDEMWADDYDTLVRISGEGWRQKDTLRVQSEGPDGSMQFIGEFAFTADRTQCLVARPFSGDLAVIDAERFKIERTHALGGQPFEIALLRDASVIARDRRSGLMLRTSL